MPRLNRKLTVDLLRRAVKLTVDTGIAQDGLHVFAGFGKRDGLDKLLRIAVMALAQPISDAVAAGVVGRESVFELSVVLVDHIFEVARAQFEIDGGRVELRRAVPFELDLFRDRLTGFR